MELNEERVIDTVLEVIRNIETVKSAVKEDSSGEEIDGIIENLKTYGMGDNLEDYVGRFSEKDAGSAAQKSAGSALSGYGGEDFDAPAGSAKDSSGLPAGDEKDAGSDKSGFLSAQGNNTVEETDITDRAVKNRPLLENPEDREALERMMKTTTARIGVGSAGPRLKTQTMLTLRADHANARDAVMMDVDQEVIDSLGLFSVQTKCTGKNEYLTRPDLGRILSDEAAAAIEEKCVKNPDVQFIVADGLSSTAINANIQNVLPVVIDGLNDAGINTGTPFFVKYGRVAVEDQVCEIVGAKVVCIFVGERPGLGSAESMSAYIAYKATVGMPEARRTVVSNIHKDGITAVEAGAYMTDLIQKILEKKASGVELQG